MKSVVAIVLGVVVGGSQFAFAEGANLTPTVTPDALHRYVKRDEPVFQWQQLRKDELDLGTVSHLRVTSQKWKGIVWKHAVEVYEPAEVAYPQHALLFVTGGSRPKLADKEDVAFGLKLATLCKARVVMLHQVPNQPLFDGKKEDDLITETWLRYLETGDDSWPLLFPMVKSAVKTMDAVQELAKSKWSQPVKSFVITGASKRGWTSWLTPVVDRRIVATAPMVIDVLNFRAQMNHQLDTWGRFSEQIFDYTSKGLVKRPDETETEREAALRTMMDPYTYRKSLTLPKLLIVGTNDPYWVVNAMSLYWDDLTGSRFIRQVPNAGHGLKGGREGAMTTLAVFFRHIASGTKLPQITWKFSSGNKQLKLVIDSNTSPVKARLWSARSKDRDFRDDRWESQELDPNGGKPTAVLSIPDSGHIALFGEVEYKFEGLSWTLSTLVYRR